MPLSKNPATNTTKKHYFFTVVIAFDQEQDFSIFRRNIRNFFLSKHESVYFVELVSSTSIRLERNVHPERLEAKPSKTRCRLFSKKNYSIPLKNID